MLPCPLPRCPHATCPSVASLQVLGDLGKQCPSTEDIDAFFADLDKDGNMLISKDEMAAFITKMTADLFAA
jgi:Ca2+-binding EF-hand superfamily protein